MENPIWDRFKIIQLYPKGKKLEVGYWMDLRCWLLEAIYWLRDKGYRR